MFFFGSPLFFVFRIVLLCFVWLVCLLCLFGWLFCIVLLVLFLFLIAMFVCIVGSQDHTAWGSP